MTATPPESDAGDAGPLPPSTTTSERSRWIVWSAWLAMLAFATRDALLEVALVEHVDAIEAVLFDASTSLPALHFGLFLWVAVRRRATLLAPADLHARPLLGLAVAAAGLGLLAWSRTTGHADLQIDTLVLVVGGTALALGGLRRLEGGAAAARPARALSPPAPGAGAPHPRRPPALDRGVRADPALAVHGGRSQRPAARPGRPPLRGDRGLLGLPARGLPADGHPRLRRVPVAQPGPHRSADRRGAAPRPPC